ncbi:alginate export family protein [bacterium]|nr:alginate export family protein [bacterium]
MIRIKKIQVSLWLAFALSDAAWPQSPIYSFSGQIRYRSEVEDRSFLPRSKPNHYHLLRSRFGLQVRPEPGIQVFLQMQDSRPFGGENTSLARGTMDASADALDFHQAYFMLDRLFSTPLQLKIGRQELRYGNERLIGVNNWSNTGRVFDACVLSYKNRVASLDVFYSRLSGGQNSANADNLVGIFSTLRPNGSLVCDGYLLHDYLTKRITSGIDQGKDLLRRYTVGLHVHSGKGGLQWALEGYRQAGARQVQEGLPLADIRSAFLSADVRLVLAAKSATALSLSACRISGDSDPGDRTARSFDLLFGSKHGFYGLMDYYPDRLFADQGLEDYAVSLTTLCSDRLQLAAQAHAFRTDVPLPSSAAKSIGEELDVTLNWTYSKTLTLEAGCCAFFPAALVRSTHGSAVSTWGYVMTTLTF